MPNDDEVLVRVHATTVTPDRLRLAQRDAVLRPLLHRAPPAEAADPGHGVRRRGRGGRRGRHGVRASATTSSASTGVGAHAEFVAVRESARARAQAGGAELRGGGGRLRRRVHRALVPAERPTSGRAGASSSTAPRARSGRRRCSSRKHFGAHVTAVCDTKNVELVRSLGADEVDRLHARGLHEERQDLRRHLRRGRQALVPPLPALAAAERHLHRRPTSGSCGTCRCSPCTGIGAA